ncbi:MAG: hypothetical protein J7K75_09920 [Desulfuromonas sp.]|nr:hypothetical protein [Desulfuromonas sp.]
MSEKLDRRRVDDGRYANDRRQRRERREGPDSWSRSLRWFAVSGWALVVGSFFLVSFAKPQTVTFFERINKLPVRKEWDLALMDYVFWMLFCGIIVGFVGLLVNLMRRRRKHDVFYFSLLALGVVSLLAFFAVLTL